MKYEIIKTLLIVFSSMYLYYFLYLTYIKLIFIIEDEEFKLK
jgi:hypothetical protein